MATYLATPEYSHPERKNLSSPNSVHNSHPLLNLPDCSSDLRKYSRNLGTPAQNQLVFTDTDASRLNSSHGRQSLVLPGIKNLPNASVPFVPTILQSVEEREPMQQQQPMTEPRTFPQQALRTYSSYQPPSPAEALYSKLFSSEVISLNSAVLKQGGALPERSAYPDALRLLLHQSSQRSMQPGADSGTLYTVVEHIDSAYMSNTIQYIGTYANTHAANVAAAEYFTATYGNQFDDYEPDFELKDGTMLRCEVETDGSMGGDVIVYVREAGGNEGKVMPRRVSKSRKAFEEMYRKEEEEKNRKEVEARKARDRQRLAERNRRVAREALEESKNYR